MNLTDELWSQAAKRRASLERLDFMAGPTESLLIHAEFMLMAHDFSSVRSREVAKDIDILREMVASALREHDANVAASAGTSSSRYGRMTSLTASVLELGGLDLRDLFLRVGGEETLPFTAVDAALPFCGGSVRWSRGTLQCSLNIRNRQCWFNGNRVLASYPAALPDSVLLSFTGKPLKSLVEIEGLNFEATIADVRQKDNALLIEIEMPVIPE